MFNSYEDIISLLKKNDIKSQEIQNIVRSKYISYYKVQKALVFNPSTPLQVSLRYLDFLLLKDLERLLNNFFVSHILKKKAENLIKTRYEALSLGEKSEISRSTKARVLLFKLLSEEQEILWYNTLMNPHLYEKDLVFYIRTKLKNSNLANYIINKSRWRSNYKIKRALAYNRNIPIYLIERVSEDLMNKDIIDLLNDDSVSNETKTILWESLKIKISILEEEEQLLYCEYNDKWIINALIELKSSKIYLKLLSKTNISKSQVMIIKHNTHRARDFDKESKKEILACISKKLTRQ